MADTRPILVTGAAGCIGSWVIARLLARGLRPVAFDVSQSRRRLYLALAKDEADAVPWETGDLTETETVTQVVRRHEPQAIVHLAALQIPFCVADPVAGARVNVVGTVNVFEAARHHGVERLVYASSVAALAPEGQHGPTTLYGVYKVADEGIARIYALDWGVASIGIRPHTVYGPGRDQGRTSAPTKAMLAAAAGRLFAMPYTGRLRMQHVHEVADAFIAAALAEVEGAHVGDLEGVAASIPEIVAEIRNQVPDADIPVPQNEVAFAIDQSDAHLRGIIGDWPRVGLEDGVAMTIAAFRDLLARGLVEPQSE